MTSDISVNLTILVYAINYGFLQETSKTIINLLNINLKIYRDVRKVKPILSLKKNFLKIL